MAGPVPGFSSVIFSWAVDKAASGVLGLQPATRTAAASNRARNGRNSRGRNSWRRNIRLTVYTGESHQQAVEPLYVLRRVRELAALGERRLLIQNLRELLELPLIPDTLEILHQRMLDIQLERGLGLRHLLSRGREDAPHVSTHVMLAQGEAGGRIRQTRADTHRLDSIAHSVFNALQEAFALLQLVLMMFLLFLCLEAAELEIPARGILELLTLEVVDLSHDPLVDALGEQQDFQAPLLETLDVRAGARGVEAVGDDEVDTVLTGLHPLDVLREAG